MLRFFLSCRFTYTTTYLNLLKELGDQAGQHEVVAENLSTHVVQELATLVKQLKDDRRKVEATLTQQHSCRTGCPTCRCALLLFPPISLRQCTTMTQGTPGAEHRWSTADLGLRQEMMSFLVKIWQHFGRPGLSCLCSTLHFPWTTLYWAPKGTPVELIPIFNFFVRC